MTARVINAPTSPRVSASCRERAVQSMEKPCGKTCSASFSMVSIACPLLMPSAACAVIAAAVYKS